jgi:hypothetical protein
MTDKAQEAHQARNLMLLDLIQLLPEKPGDGALIISMIGAVFGAALWIAGVKVSRPLVTLVTVLLGATIGMQLPRWFGWQISGAGTAVGGAVVLGVSGFVLHRMWVGIGLGLVLALWAACAMWLTMSNGASWSWPEWSESSACCEYLTDAWANVPPNIARFLPYAAIVAMVSAIASCIIWPKLTTVTAWSAIGLTMCIGLMTASIAMTHRDWLDRAPQHTWVQLASLAGLLFVGAAVQWKLSPKSKSSSSPSPKPKPDKTKD